MEEIKVVKKEKTNQNSLAMQKQIKFATEGKAVGKQEKGKQLHPEN